MKKSFLLVAAITMFALASFKSDNNIIVVKGTIDDWSNVLNALYQSNAPHVTVVVPAINFVYGQLPDSVKTKNR